jgi:hypothetical protein
VGSVVARAGPDSSHRSAVRQSMRHCYPISGATYCQIERVKRMIQTILNDRPILLYRPTKCV